MKTARKKCYEVTFYCNFDCKGKLKYILLFAVLADGYFKLKSA